MGTTIGRTPHTARSLVDRCIVESSVGPDDGRPSLGKGRTSTRQPGFWKSRALIVTVTYVPSPARLLACSPARLRGGASQRLDANCGSGYEHHHDLVTVVIDASGSASRPAM